MPQIPCNRCGRDLGEHLDPAVKKLCAGAIKRSPAEVKAIKVKVLSRLKTHTPDRKNSPSRPRNPRITH